MRNQLTLDSDSLARLETALQFALEDSVSLSQWQANSEAQIKFGKCFSAS